MLNIYNLYYFVISHKTIYFRTATVSIDWETAYIKLPVGRRRVYIEAHSIPETTTSEVPLILVAIDDIYIGRCDPDRSFCSIL